MTLRVPDNAYGYSFDHKFYTYEWPAFVCHQHNDFFIVEMTPFPLGQTDGNVAFDAEGNPLSANNAAVDVCTCWNGPPCMTKRGPFDCEVSDR